MIGRQSIKITGRDEHMLDCARPSVATELDPLAPALRSCSR